MRGMSTFNLQHRIRLESSQPKQRDTDVKSDPNPDGALVQVAASSEVSVVSVEDVPAEVVQKETDIEMGKEDILKKPENIRFESRYPISLSAAKVRLYAPVLQWSLLLCAPHPACMCSGALVCTHRG